MIKPRDTPDLFADPFREQVSRFALPEMRLLGGRFRFESNSRSLLRLAEVAYQGLPAHKLSAESPSFKVSLVAMSGEQPRASRKYVEPPPLQMLSGAGLLAGATGGSDFVTLSSGQRAALVAVSESMARSAYHTRYEMIEFAVFTLAARAQRLVPLHSACLGEAGCGLLLMGDSGSGKSTVALLALLHGLDFISEDSAFVTPDTLLATGVANFLHVGVDSLQWIPRAAAAAIRRSPVIQRRSGARKFEVDLRHGNYRLAAQPLPLGAVVFLSRARARRQPLLTKLSRVAALRALTRAQPYAAGQPQWRTFLRNVLRAGVYELRRGPHPLDSVAALRDLLRDSAARVNS